MRQSILTKEQMREILKEYNVKTAEDINNALKDLFGGLLQEALEAELDTELGYPKNGSQPEDTTNRRNGHTRKTVRSEHGEMELSVPRDRESACAPGMGAI
jgi:transposase-like protein